MNQPTHNGPAGLGLSREEAWVLHAAVLDYVDAELDADNTPEREAALLDAIEASADLDDDDVTRLSELLARYLDDAPEADRPHARAILDDTEMAHA